MGKTTRTSSAARLLTVGLAGPLLMAPSNPGTAFAASGEIAGLVTGGGAPLADVRVMATNPAGGAEMGRTMTGADGRYVLQLPDGRYHLTFAPPEESPYAQQVYFGQTSIPGSTQVVVSGARVSGIDAALPHGYRIRGTVLDARTGSGLPGVSVTVYIADHNGTWMCCYGATGTFSEAAGVYSAKVPPGRFRVRFSANGYPTQWWPKLNIESTVDGHRAAADVVVGSADTLGIDAALGASGAQRSCFDPALAPTATVYLPNITKTLGGPSGWVTPFIVQNVGTAATALEASFYDFATGARVICRRIENLQPGTSFAHVPNEDPDLPHYSQFSVVVRSYGSNVVSVVNEHQGTGARAEALSYVGLSSGATTVHLPYLAKNFRGWLTTFIVQNVGTATANVTIQLKSHDGLRSVTLTRSILPGRSAAIDPTIEDTIARFDELSGVVTSTQPIAVVVNAHNDSPTVGAPMGYSYNGIPASTATTTYVPYLMKQNLEFDPGKGQLYIQNIGSTDATPLITARRLGTSTSLSIAAPAPIKPGATWAFDPQIYKVQGGYQLCRNAGAGKCLDPGEHSIVITGGSFAALNAMVDATTAMGIVGTTTTATKLYLPNVTRTLGGADGWSTPIVVQSAGASTATVRWYRFADGALVHTQTLSSLAAGGAQQIDPRSVSALVDATQYAVVVEADGQIAAIVRELNFQGGDGAMGYEGFSVGP